MLHLSDLHAEIVRRLIKLDERNRSPRLTQEETQYLRGQMAVLMDLAKWNPEAEPVAPVAAEETFGLGLPEAAVPEVVET